MDSTSERNRLITADVIANAWNDDAFKKKLLANPTAILKKSGIEGIADNHSIIAHENTDLERYFVLPSNTSPAHYLPALEKLLSNTLPIHPSTTLTLVQNSPNVTHLVVPQKPQIAKGKADASHASLAAAVGWQTATMNTSPVVHTDVVTVTLVNTVMDGGITVSVAVQAAAVVLT